MFAALTDRNDVDYRVEDGKIIELATAVPRPYLRVIELTAGVLEEPKTGLILNIRISIIRRCSKSPNPMRG